MTESIESKRLLVVELLKRQSDGGPDTAQFVQRHWICDAGKAIGFEAGAVALDRALDACGPLLAADESEVHESWRGALDKEIWEALESAGTVDGLDGVAVVEVVIHTRAGPVLSTRARRFLVIQRGTNSAIFACDSLNVAFTLARNLSAGLPTPAGQYQAIEKKLTRRYGIR
ncbi:hypothetical protein GUG13_17515 [Xanthomonas citri pv. citri]|nr:hypothetical protein [Xanthomonas citri pv. citri]